MSAPTQDWRLLLDLPVSLDTPATPWTWRLWECAERVAAACSLAVLSPALIGLGTAVALASGQSPLVAHRRVGWRGETLWLLKFRTMWDGAPQHTGEPLRLVERLWNTSVPDHKSQDDPRVTHPLARWMRRYSLDELPQLWHVAAGKMSLAGPRPVTAAELATHYSGSAGVVLTAKPGITGLWQVRGRNNLTYRQRRRLDLFLVRTHTLSLHLAILAWTIPAVLKGENAR